MMRKNLMQNTGDGGGSVPRERKHRLRDGVAALLGMPSDSDLSEDGFMAEVRGCGSVTVRGCRRILTYTPTEISLLTRDGQVRVVGTGLACFSYFHGAIGIEGCIEGILLEHAAAMRRGRGEEAR